MDIYFVLAILWVPIHLFLRLLWWPFATLISWIQFFISPVIYIAEYTIAATQVIIGFIQGLAVRIFTSLSCIWLHL
jgi:hypothetical protein